MNDLRPCENFSSLKPCRNFEVLEAALDAHLRDPTAFSEHFVVMSFKELANAPSSLSRLRCLISAARFFYVNSIPLLGLEATDIAVQSAISLKDKSLQRLAFMLHGIFLADCGNFLAAIDCQVRALNVSQAMDDQQAEKAVWQNLGLAFMHARQYKQAIRCFERIIKIEKRNPPVLSKQVSHLARTNMALICLHTGDYQRGLREIQTAILMNDAPTNAPDLLTRVFAECNFSRLLLAIDDLEKAANRLAIAAMYASSSRAVRAEIRVKTVEGLIKVYRGECSLGFMLLSESLARAKSLRPSLHSSINEVLLSIIDANEQVGRPDRSLPYLRELITHHSGRQMSHVFAHHHGKSGSELARHEESLEDLAIAAELREDHQGEHIYRVGRLSALLAAECEHNCHALDHIEVAARLHDIGKIILPDSLVMKAGPLTAEEREMVQGHSAMGADLLTRSLGSEHLACVVARYHHEWWDGTGYPLGLAGTDIPLAARITALAEVFDALTHSRCYRSTLTTPNALIEIRALRGKQFDPELCDLFIELVTRLSIESPDLDRLLLQDSGPTPYSRAMQAIEAALARPI